MWRGAAEKASDASGTADSSLVDCPELHGWHQPSPNLDHTSHATLCYPIQDAVALSTSRATGSTYQPRPT
jgi:hypothetical protein